MTAGHRKFTDKPLTHSMAHHLSAVAHLLTVSGYARVSDIARYLDLTRGSVSVSMKGLCAAGLVEQDDNRFFHLTVKGRRAVSSVHIRHAVVKRFLVDLLGLEAEEAHRQSCQFAYLVEAPTTRRLAALLEQSLPRRVGGDLTPPSPPGCPGCEFAGDRTNCPCCGLECLSNWLPLLNTRPPCQESLHVG